MSEETLRLMNEHAVVFVDETGHDRFHDPRHPVFGWAGCAMTVGQYDRVAAAWRALKKRHFPGVAVMHAAALHRPTGEQLEALGRFFRGQPFQRFGAVVRHDAPMEPAVLNGVAAATAKRIEAVLAYLPFRRLALVFEAGEAWTSKVNAMFGPMQLREDGREIAIDKHSLAKEAAEPGLEIADFIAHAVGGVGRTHDCNRQDFRAVFRSGPKERASFMLVRAVGRQAAQAAIR